jgi:MFS family permease
MGILNAAGFAPFLLLTLPAGVLVDRQRRRPILIASDIGRAVLLGLIPLLAFLSLLRIEYMIAISFLVGVLTVFFHLAYQSYLPALVERDQLVEGNSKLIASDSVAQIGGPGLAGLLVELVTAPFTILVDALSYAVSAISLGLIRTTEPAPRHVEGRSVWNEIGEGLRVVFGNSYLRAIAAEAATYNLFWNVLEAVYVLYAVRELGMRPGIIGLIFMVGSVGSLLGAVLADRIARRFGVGSTILGAMALGCIAPILIPLASGQTVGAAALLAAALFFGGIGVAISNVHVVSLRQTITPDRLLGRMNASYRSLVYGAIPLGALVGGFLGEQIGLRPTLLVGALGMSVAWVWVLFSPIRTLRRMPAAADEPLGSVEQRVGSEVSTQA